MNERLSLFVHVRSTAAAATLHAQCHDASTLLPHHVVSSRLYLPDLDVYRDMHDVL